MSQSTKMARMEADMSSWRLMYDVSLNVIYKTISTEYASIVVYAHHWFCYNNKASNTLEHQIFYGTTTLLLMITYQKTTLLLMIPYQKTTPSLLIPYQKTTLLLMIPYPKNTFIDDTLPENHTFIGGILPENHTFIGGILPENHFHWWYLTRKPHFRWWYLTIKPHFHWWYLTRKLHFHWWYLTIKPHLASPSSFSTYYLWESPPWEREKGMYWWSRENINMSIVRASYRIFFSGGGRLFLIPTQESVWLK